MQTALKYGQKALHLEPNDKVILYNIAMIEQKSAELLFAVPVAKRKLAELKRVIAQANHAQKCVILYVSCLWFSNLCLDFSTL